MCPIPLIYLSKPSAVCMYIYEVCSEIIKEFFFFSKNTCYLFTNIHFTCLKALSLGYNTLVLVLFAYMRFPIWPWALSAMRSSLRPFMDLFSFVKRQKLQFAMFREYDSRGMIAVLVLGKKLRPNSDSELQFGYNVRCATASMFILFYLPRTP